MALCNAGEKGDDVGGQGRAHTPPSGHTSYTREQLRAIRVTVGPRPGDRRVLIIVPPRTSGSGSHGPEAEQSTQVPAMAGAVQEEQHTAVVVRRLPSTDHKCAVCGAHACMWCRLCGAAYCSKKCLVKDRGARTALCEWVEEDSMPAPAQREPAEDKGLHAPATPRGLNVPVRIVQPSAGPRVCYVSERMLPAPNCPMVPVWATTDLLYLHQESLIPELQKLNDRLNDWLRNKCALAYHSYSKGDYVSCLSSQDSTWYRGQVMEECPNGKFTVFFLDYGNSEEVGTESLLSLPTHVGLVPRFAFRVVPQGGVSAPLVHLLNEEPSVRVILLKAAADQRSVPVVHLERLDGTCLTDRLQDQETIRIKPVQLQYNDRFKASVAAREGRCIYLRTFPGGNTLASLQGKLEAHGAESGAPEYISTGDAVCARGEDRKWHRATVTAVTRATEAGDLFKVLLVDTGTTVVVTKEDLRSLPQDLASCMPSLAVKVHLVGVYGRLTDKLLDPYVGQVVTVEVTDQQGDDPPSVRIFSLSGEYLNSVLQRLATKWARRAAFEERVLPSGRSRVTIAHISDLGQLFYLQQQRLRLPLMMLMAELNSGEPAALQTSRLDLGNAVCARYSGNGRWHRAIIFSSPDEDGRYLVSFPDFGYQEMVAPCDIRALPEGMKDPPLFAMCVGLKGVKSISTECKVEMQKYEFEMEIVEWDRLPCQAKLYARSGRCVNRLVY